MASNNTSGDWRELETMQTKPRGLSDSKGKRYTASGRQIDGDSMLSPLHHEGSGLLHEERGRGDGSIEPVTPLVRGQSGISDGPGARRGGGGGSGGDGAAGLGGGMGPADRGGPEWKDQGRVTGGPFARFGMYARRTGAELRRRKGASCLAFTCVFLVVVIVAVADNALANAPIVFLNLSRGEKGDGDVVVYGVRNDDDDAALNTTEIEARVGGGGGGGREPFLVAPRIEQRVIVMGDTDARRALPRANEVATDNTWAYSGVAGGYDAPEGCEVSGRCFFELFNDAIASASLYAFDHRREVAADVGKELIPDPGLADGECAITVGLARVLGVATGDYVFVPLDLTDAPLGGAVVDGVPADPPGRLGEGYWDITRLVTLGQRWNTVLVPYRVALIFRGSEGKVPSFVTDAILVPLEHFFTAIARHARPQLPDVVRASLARKDPAAYASIATINVEPPRSRYYADPDFDTVLRQVTGFASRMLYRVGFEQVSASLPLLRGMYDTRFFALFLGLILIVVVWILSFLSILLISSLLTVSVETRTFELGVMRTLGMQRRWIVELLLTHAAAYSIPAWCIGLVVAQVIAAMLSRTVFSSAGDAVRPMLRPASIVLASALGLGIPFFAALLPIRRALGKNLVESLDVTRSKTKAVTVSITRSQDSAISLPAVIVGIGLVVFGFLIVYIVPLALLSGNFGLLLNVFFGLLLGMMLGLVMLSINLTQSLERLVSWTFFFWDRRAVGDILRKNLVAHRLRNRKTSMMYACTVGFIVFILVAVQLQVTSFTYGVRQRYGTPLRVVVDGVSLKGSALQELDFRLREDERIADVAYSSYSLGSILGASSTRFMNLGRTFTFSSVVRAVSPNFYDVLGGTFLVQDETDPDVGWSIDEQLYSRRGSGSVILGSLIKSKLDLGGIDGPLLLETVVPFGAVVGSAEDQSINPDPSAQVEEQEGDGGGDTSSDASSSSSTSTSTSTSPDGEGSANGTAAIFASTSEDQARSDFRRLTGMAFIDSSPGMVFSKFPSVTRQNSLVSFPTMRRLCGGAIDSVADVPVRVAYVRPVDGLSDEEMDDLVSHLESVAARVSGADVEDIRDEIEPVLDTAQLLDMFFSIITVVAMVLCFFSLSTSMATNIHEQVKEIAILRAVGMQRPLLLRVYVYEAFVVVLSASLLGVLIGTMVGFTMTLQRALFTLRPIAFFLPVNTLIVILITSVIVAIISAFGPAWRVSKKSIVLVMREAG